jgi:16S rRNA (uracil1498-N3)-methyltransferase
MRKIRLFIQVENLTSGTVVKVVDGFNYLINVMRLRLNDEVCVFNGQDGEWLAQVVSINKKDCNLEVKSKIREQYFPPKITLAFAPVKNARTEFIVEKATELGISNFQPILTKHSVVDKINSSRFQAHIKEAAEQCERLDLPQLHNLISLKDYLKNLSEDKILILADESGNGLKASQALKNIDTKNKEIIIFTGPEGGFEKQEFQLFSSKPNLIKINLGPRIL